MRPLTAAFCTMLPLLLCAGCIEQTCDPDQFVSGNSCMLKPPDMDDASTPSQLDASAISAPEEEPTAVVQGTRTCSQAIDCVQGCTEGDMDCATECAEGMRSSSATLLDNFVGCVGQQCPEGTPASCAITATFGACNADFTACTGDVP